MHVVTKEGQTCGISSVTTLPLHCSAVMKPRVLLYSLLLTLYNFSVLYLKSVNLYLIQLNIFFFLYLSQFRDDLLKKLKIYILQTPNHLQGMSIG